VLGTVIDVIAKMGVATIRLTPESAALPPPVGDGEEFAFGKFELDPDDDGEYDEEEDADGHGDGRGGGGGGADGGRLGGGAEETVVVELASLLDIRLVPPA
jgi:hypothetical protein